MSEIINCYCCTISGECKTNKIPDDYNPYNCEEFLKARKEFNKIWDWNKEK